METTPNTQTLPPKIRDLFGYNAAIADEELSFATARCIYALDRRHRLQERVRFGSLALNSAALLALLSMAGGEHGKLTALGIGSDTVATGTALFIIGAILAGLAIWVSTNHFIEVTGLEVESLYAARKKKALFDSLSSEEVDRRIKAVLDEPAPEMGDFKYSKLDMFLTNGSGSMWLVGTGAILFDVMMKITGGFCGSANIC